MDSRTEPINWFPGHMAKSRRLLSEQIGRADLVIELCDARLPYSSRNPELNQIINKKNRILLLNKSDLADPQATKKWIQYFKTKGIQSYAINSPKMNRKELVRIIDQATKENIEKYMAKGIRKTVRVVVIGVPNVGKSTFINRIRGSGVVQTGDKPGITKSQHWVHISPYLELLDTPGMLWPRLDDQIAAKRLCYIGSVKDDVIDLYNLSISLLEELKNISPGALKERFHLENSDLNGQSLLDAVCQGRGWLQKGNRYDYDRGCSIILDEFRAGKLGNISLEMPQNDSEE